MKHTKYIVIPDSDYEDNHLLDTPLVILNTKKEAKTIALDYTTKNDTYRVYEIERVD